MLERLLEQENVVSHILSTDSPQVDNLTPNQWTTAAQLLSTLRPFVQVTEEMSATSYPLLSSVIPTVVGLRRALASSMGGHETLVDILLRLVRENFGDVLDDDQLCAATVVGSLVKSLVKLHEVQLTCEMFRLTAPENLLKIELWS